MATTTPRLNLTKPAGTETVGVGTLNTNFDKIDAGGNGTYVCTSASRPASPFTGMLIYETDTALTRLWTGTDWIYVSGPMHVEFTHTASAVANGGTSGVGTLTVSSGFTSNNPGFSTGTNTLTIPNTTSIKQVWLIQWSCNLSGTVGSNRAFVAIYSNTLAGALLARSPFGNGDDWASVNVNTIIPTGGFTVAFGVSQTSGAALTANGSIRCSRIS